MEPPVLHVDNGEPAEAEPSEAKAGREHRLEGTAVSSSETKAELQHWLDAAAASQPGSSGTSVAQLHQNEQESKHSLRQFVLTIVLIGLYAIGNAALIVQWFRGQVEATIAVAAVGNIGVFVGAAVAYYFAGTSSK